MALVLLIVLLAVVNFELAIDLMFFDLPLFLFRQFFLTVPEELCEAAKIDGASPMKFFTRILLPLSKTNIAALIVTHVDMGSQESVFIINVESIAKQRCSRIWFS